MYIFLKQNHWEWSLKSVFIGPILFKRADFKGVINGFTANNYLQLNLSLMSNFCNAKMKINYRCYGVQ